MKKIGNKKTGLKVDNNYQRLLRKSGNKILAKVNFIK